MTKPDRDQDQNLLSADLRESYGFDAGLMQADGPGGIASSRSFVTEAGTCGNRGQKYTFRLLARPRGARGRAPSPSCCYFVVRSPASSAIRKRYAPNGEL